MQRITATQLRERISNGSPVHLIDVRSPAEYQAAHVPGSVLTPLETLDPHAVARLGGGNGDERLYVLCQTGLRAQRACEQLLAAGCDNVVLVEGGASACAKANIDMVCGRRGPISLERQVRIAAGLLVLLGVILAVLVHPWLLAISGFVGAGLVFAGITNTWGMGMLLARMP